MEGLLKRYTLYILIFIMAIEICSVVVSLYLTYDTQRILLLWRKRDTMLMQTKPNLAEAKHSKVASVKLIHYFNKPKTVNINEFEKCEFRCLMTINNCDYHKSDAVIFHGPALGTKVKPPKKTKNQIWIFHSVESPAHGVTPQRDYHNYSKWKTLFNWTFTYRRDSDIPNLYGGFRSKVNHQNFGFTHTFYQLKSKSVAWFVSNCETPGKRERYVNRLSRFKKIDIFGRCGNFTCSKQHNNKCKEILNNQYMFYLAFENSICFDYITETSFKIFQNVGVIPVTRGTVGQYSTYLPPGSFINTDNLKTVRELATYLDIVETNATLFNSFFNWKTYYDTYVPYGNPFCELCKKVHNADQYRSIYMDIGKWVSLQEYRNVCTSSLNWSKKHPLKGNPKLWKL